MRIGVLKEIKNHEYRVDLTPASVAELSAQGPCAAIGFADEDYPEAGAYAPGAEQRHATVRYHLGAEGTHRLVEDPAGRSQCGWRRDYL